ncbi:hypothetical protein LPB19_16690 [Marinobacter salinisoli]|uniref:Right handed beta helix domain-containing protein n=1 Tax=Marinobacter salinisoli TaxID=2769486 RepID=A0ABX7MTT0_9GAMM|nr:hypothetical protein [Marinobacter salinisoli]QSP94784.1 hypothetical protein LPB19_16690 [Marinobacter salinisoli]
MAATPCLNAPALASPTGDVVSIRTVSELQSAIGNLSGGQTLLIEPGVYNVPSTLFVRKDNVTIRGNSDRCDDVRLVFPGMENRLQRGHGFWSDATGFRVQNLSIEEVYYHGIILNPGAEAPEIYNVRIFNSGQQFVKANPYSFGDGVDNGKVEYAIFEYESGPPTTDHDGGTGYTNGVDVHAGRNWVIRNSYFVNFHTPDSADHLWNPAILMWNGAADTIVENNVFHNVDRAIAFGLSDRGNDHSGGIIRNNMITYDRGLYSNARKSGSDGAIIVWGSPNTKVLHNTILTNGNLNLAIEFRFNTAGSESRNNLTDAGTGTRNGGTYARSGNYANATPDLFVAPDNADLHVKDGGQFFQDRLTVSPDAPLDVDGQIRTDGLADAGADEWPGFKPAAPGNFMVQ